MAKELLGYCAVDSGQLIVVDPCYLKEWNHGKNDELDNHYGLACLATSLKAQGGEILVSGMAGTGVAFSSGWGDGSYPVYAHYDRDGRVSKIEILF